MNRSIDSDGADDLIPGLMTDTSSTADLIRTTRSREDGYKLSDDEENSPDRGALQYNGTYKETDEKDDDDSAAVSKRRSSDEADAKTKLENDLSSAEMIDDPVRMYLREIGRVSLLKAAEERVLAREFEVGRYVSQLESALAAPEGGRRAVPGTHRPFRRARSCCGQVQRSALRWPAVAANDI